MHHMEGNLKLLAELRHRREVEAFKPQIHADRRQFKMPGIESADPGHGVQERQGILAAGNSYGDMVVFINQLVFVNCLPYKAHQSS